jgi:hypothetical protein
VTYTVVDRPTSTVKTTRPFSVPSFDQKFLFGKNQGKNENNFEPPRSLRRGTSYSKITYSQITGQRSLVYRVQDVDHN